MKPLVRPIYITGWLQKEAEKAEVLYSQKARFLRSVAGLVNNDSTIGNDRATKVMEQIDTMLKQQGPSNYEMAHAVVAIATLLNSFRS